MSTRADQTQPPDSQQHISELIRELPIDSSLRQQLIHGVRGDGVHHEWMDLMRRNGIRRTVVWVSISFDRHGKPKRMIVERIRYFSDYEQGEPIYDGDHLSAIHASGLEQKLNAAALQKAEHGFWVDVPHPRPHPFTGGVKVDFFDDEWLPNPTNGVLFCAGKDCLSDVSVKN